MIVPRDAATCVSLGIPRDSGLDLGVVVFRIRAPPRPPRGSLLCRALVPTRIRALEEEEVGVKVVRLAAGA